MISAISPDVVDPDGELVGGVQAVLPRDLVQPVEQGPALGAQPGGELADQQQRRDPVLVPDQVGGDAVAERLLVAVDQSGHPADPLEPGQRLGVARARAGRPGLASSDEDTIVVANTPRRPRRTRWSAEQRARPRRRAASASRAPSGTATAHRSASGSFATTMSAAVRCGPGPWPGRSPPAPPGWGTTRWESPDRAPAARVRRPAAAKPGAPEDLGHGLVADAVQRGVDDAELARRPGLGQGGDGRRGRRPGPRRRGPASRRARGTVGRRRRRRRCAGRSRRRPVARSGCRRRGRPCSRCPAAGCARPSP